MNGLTLKFAVCCLIIFFLTGVHSFFPETLSKFRHFDKIQHALAGIFLVIGFSDDWKGTARRVFFILLAFNFAWETYEAIHAHFAVDAYSWRPFGKKWFADTWTDIAVTMLSGMSAYFLIKNTKK